MNHPSKTKENMAYEIELKNPNDEITVTNAAAS